MGFLDLFKRPDIDQGVDAAINGRVLTQEADACGMDKQRIEYQP